MKTLDEYIEELQDIAKERGGDVAVQTDDGEDPTAEWYDDDPDDPCVLIG
jgi:hypothetical protein